jgi:hypothetical protein
MVREISAGGVVVRKKDDLWWMAAIELPTAPETNESSASHRLRSKPSGSEPSSSKLAPSKSKPVICRPTGLVDTGEKPLHAALREAREETGLRRVQS